MLVWKKVTKTITALALMNVIVLTDHQTGEWRRWLTRVAGVAQRHFAELINVRLTGLTDVTVN
ncbi:MAG: hypothetical protein BGO78_05360 [Chloroflexi bacterium 44-23]|nr:MAG: hypothetical protein BGO78_05360 [Chloroflexi bacterium 44-23]